MFAHGEILTVVAAETVEDEVGNSTSTTAEKPWGPVAVWDRLSSESVDQSRPPVIIGLTVAGPRIAIDAGDQVIRGELTYEVDGPPQVNTVSPFTGWDPGIVVNLKTTAAR